MSSDLRPVRDVLARLRARLRRERLLRAVGWVAGAAALTVLASFLLDLAVDMPLVVRTVHLLVVLAGLVALTIWASAPMRIRLSDEDLAQALESAMPRLADRVASALDFEQRIDDRTEPESRQMMRAVIGQAAAAVRQVRPADLVESSGSRRALGVAAGAVLVLAVTAGALSDDFGLWVKRGVLLQDLEWPKRTHVDVLDFDPGVAKVVTHGQDLQVTAEVTGDVPREVLLHYEALEHPDDGGDPEVTETDVRRMFAIEDEGGATGRFAFQFRAISTSFRFWVTGGDDDDADPIHEVRAMIPPRIASITARVTYPEHSGLPPAVVREANFEVLRGSQVELELTASMPLESAQLVPEDGPASELGVEGEDRDVIRIDLAIVDDVQFHVGLTAATGQSNREEDDRFLVRALADRAPDLRVLFPLGRLYRTPVGVVPVKALVKDDFGLADARLVTALGDDVREVDVLAEAAAAAGAGDDGAGDDGTGNSSTGNNSSGAAAQRPKIERADIYHAIEIADLAGSEETPVRAGDVVSVVLRATDNGGQESIAPELTVEILAPEDMERRLGQRQVGLRDQLTLLRSHQRRTLDGIRRLRIELETGVAGGDHHDTARDLQVEQGRVTGEIAQFLRGIHRVFDAYVLNRLGGAPTIERLLPLYHEALAKPVDDSETVFPITLYDGIVEQARQKRIYDPEVLGALLDIMDLGQTCERETSPGVYEALSTWADGKAGPDLVSEAERRGEDLEAKLRELDRRMEQWEAMSELVELLRQLRNRQDDLTQPVRQDGEAR